MSGTSKKRRRPDFDPPWLAKVASPALIMLMVGSLVYFFIEVFYSGAQAGRLRWIFGLFTFATVLVSRISIEEGKERAALFGIALAIATLVVSSKLVEFQFGFAPVIIIGFILLVMWSANKLTWDCTLIDRSRDVSAIGLVEIIRQQWRGRKDADRTKNQDSKTGESREASFNPLLALLGHSGKQNSPGLWVLYFAVAAFPIFGLGQWFAGESSFGWIFLLFAVYLASGLGLLMLTSLMGLRRYVAQRDATLPPAVGKGWLILGTVVCLAVMLFVLVLPRPNVSGLLSRQVKVFTSPFLGASDLGLGEDGQEVREDGNGAKNSESNEGAASKSAETKSKAAGGDKESSSGSPQSEKNGKQPSSGGKSKNRSNSKQASGKKTDSRQGESSSRQNNKRSKDSKSGGQKNGNEQKSGDQKQAQQNNNKLKGPPGSEKKRRDQQNQQAENQDQPNQRDDSKRGDQENQAKKNRAKQKNKSKRESGKSSPPRSSPSSSPSKLFSMLGGLVKFIVYAIGLVALLVALWMFRDELAAFWSSLFERKKKPESETETGPAPAVESNPAVPFARFKDPFADGRAAQWSPRELLAYTFSALESWAHENNRTREEGQTPHEFANELRDVNPALAIEARRLADLYSQDLFSKTSVLAKETAGLKNLWNLLKT